MENEIIPFIPLHCQMDYINGQITLQYEGEYNEKEARDFILKSYPEFNEKEVDHELPHFSKGFFNPGIVTFG